MRFLYCLLSGNGRDGYTVVARDLLDHLVSAGHEVDCAVLIDRPPTPLSADSNRILASLSRRILFFRHPALRGRSSWWWNRIANRLAPRRTGDRHFCPPLFYRALRSFIDPSGYDAAIAGTAAFSRLVGLVRCPTVVDLHELFTQKAKTLARHGYPAPISPYLGLGEELDAIRPFDLVWCPSAQIRKVIERALPGARPIDRHISHRAIVPDGYRPPPAPAGSRGRILFVGSTAAENRPGLILFLEEIFPRIRNAVPSVEFDIIGWDEDDLPPGFDLRNISFRGTVKSREEILSFFAGTDLVVIPRFLGGLTVKGVEALCLGKATVGHQAAFSGCYRIESWKQAVITKESGDFADAAIHLLRNPSLRAEIARNAWEFSRYRFSPERAYEDFHAGLEEILRERGATIGSRQAAACVSV
jgi:glycosyltransferase involved in cell wall biosynthesis